MTMRNTFLFAAAASVVGSLGACKWSEFDDISDKAYVAATGRPDDGATIWPIALVPAQNTASDVAGTLGVFGASEPTYNEIVLGAEGTAAIGSSFFEFESIGWGSFQTDPLVMRNPDTTGDGVGELTVITEPASASVLFFGKGAGFDYVDLNGATKIEAATYIRPGSGAPAVVVAGESDTLFARLPPKVVKRCDLVENTMPIALKALGSVVPSGSTDDHLLVWLADGRLVLYPAGVVNGDDTAITGEPCEGGVSVEPLLASTATTFQPAGRSYIIDFRDDATFGADLRLLVGRNGPNTFLQVVQVSTTGITFVGTPLTTEASASHATMRFDDASYVALGFPTATVENTVAGQVKLYNVDPATGVDSNAVLVLNDSQPEDNQGFGRAVSSVSFNGKQILAVGATNEIFTYFSTELYEDTRTAQ